MMLNTMF